MPPALAFSKKGRKKGRLFIPRHILPAATTRPGAVGVEHPAREDEASAQLTRWSSPKRAGFDR
jgi:hypothetical protein